MRSNHVHVVVCSGVKPEKTLGDLKAWCTRRLREAGVTGRDQQPWTEGGSTRWLWTDEDVGTACKYVLEAQGPDLPQS